MARKRHRKETEQVQPDLPITPMLDMSFQLMAFFIFTFRPAPTEGQLALALPKDDGGGQSIPNLSDEQPVKLTVRIEAAPNGSIEKMYLEEQGAADPKPTDLGADTQRYQAELKSRFDSNKGKPAKLTLAIGDGLLQEYVVNLYDVARRVGFEEIAPIPLNPKRR